MACGVATVASRAGQIAEVLRHGRNGLLCPAGDTAAFAAACDRLLRHESLRRSLGAAAAIRVGKLDVVLASGRAQTFNPAVFTNLGIDLASKKAVVVKSSNHFYAAFAPIAAGRPKPIVPRPLEESHVRGRRNL